MLLYICSSDNYFPKNPLKSMFIEHIIQLFIKMEKLMNTMQNLIKGRITGVTIGGKDDWIMLGHVFFDREFSDKFVKLLKSGVS